MDTTARLVPWLLIVALLTGVSGDILLHTPVWGIGFSAWALILLTGILVAARQAGGIPSRDSLMIGGLSALCALCLSWRDTLSLSSANVLALCFGAGLMLLRTGTTPLARAPLLLLLQGFSLHILHAMAGMASLILKDLPAWGRTQSSSHVRLLPVVRGFTLSLPVLVVFGVLLASADAGFQYLMEQILKIDLPEIVVQVTITALICGTVGGVLWGRHLAGDIPLPVERPKFLRMGMTEAGIILGALNLLFGVFILLQIPYFFGGHQTVLGAPSLTYAAYARRGFFELVAVIAFAIPLLLLADWLTHRQGARDVLVFRILGGVTIALLSSIMASAMWRLWLYMERFGLTEARLNAAALLCWLGIVLAWFGASVLGGRRDRFAYGAIIAGYGVLIFLNLSNPAAVVVRTNLARATAGVPFDAPYNATLSADAVPALLAGLRALPLAERDAASWELLSRYGAGGRTNWRGWNAGAAHASALVAARREELQNFLLPRVNAPTGNNQK
jgi:hypothetical protein